MANPTVNNVEGSNTGPGVTSLPDTVQMPVGNLWKVGVFNLTLSPATVATTTTAEQTFAATGIGLLTTDFVMVQKPTAQAGLFISNPRVSAADTLAITFGNTTSGTLTPSASEVYKVVVVRPQPNWSAPASGNQLDW
ncbi:hypothetical protein UFOVP154_27 [uncultured Caudovirales phage]|uniref:Uncharacterized protein n=1 Tax=uncultured Caudovirales phage TaxID=2100421 RepID=A0A6J7W8F9_9CAUD|nr:hypothetical protein UFOVP8_12 [uncultured Caudovirales phage]CAB5170461.1 hypothetical protein UFOVP154_27 [uncultured Caudovirales phage]